MHLLNTETFRYIHGGQTQPILATTESITICFISAITANTVMLALGVSPFYSFPISIFSAPISAYFYSEYKKNPA